MKWTQAEAKFVRQMAKFLRIDIDALAYGPTGLGLIGADPQEAFLRRLNSSLVSDIESDSDPGIRDSRRMESFAQFNNIDTEDEFWELKVLALIVQQHPYFALPMETKSAGRKPIPDPVRDADLHEFWIEANWLRAYLQVRIGRAVSDDDLSSEMARREHSLPGDDEEWTKAQVQQWDKSAPNFERELTTNRNAYAALMRRHSFKLPSMRENSSFYKGIRGRTAALKWTLSEAERKVDGCLEAYKSIRLEQVEAAKSPLKRSRSTRQ